jgi:hypothetical protein
MLNRLNPAGRVPDRRGWASNLRSAKQPALALAHWKIALSALVVNFVAIPLLFIRCPRTPDMNTEAALLDDQFSRRENEQL